MEHTTTRLEFRHVVEIAWLIGYTVPPMVVLPFRRFALIVQGDCGVFSSWPASCEVTRPKEGWWSNPPSLDLRPFGMSLRSPSSWVLTWCFPEYPVEASRASFWSSSQPVQLPGPSLFGEEAWSHWNASLLNLHSPRPFAIAACAGISMTTVDL